MTQRKNPFGVHRNMQKSLLGIRLILAPLELEPAKYSGATIASLYFRFAAGRGIGQLY
jgi:hypothetical protein